VLKKGEREIRHLGEVLIGFVQNLEDYILIVSQKGQRRRRGERYGVDV